MSVMSHLKSSLFAFLLLLIFASVNKSQTPQCPAPIDCSKPKLDKVLRIAVLLPSESTQTDQHNLVYHNRLESIQLGLEVIADVNNTHGVAGYKSPLADVLPGWKIEVITGDTQCSSTVGPLEAVRLQCIAGGAWLSKLFPFSPA
jgi:hypothetical protein